MATLYQSNGRVKEVQPANGVSWSQDELWSIVGGPPEILSTTDGHFMVINDMGKLKGLEENGPATNIYRNKETDYIAGPALVVDTFKELYG